MKQSTLTNLAEDWTELSALVTKINTISLTLSGQEFFDEPPLASPGFAYPELCFHRLVSRLYRLFRESGRQCLKVFRLVCRGHMAPDVLDYLGSGLEVVDALRHLEHHQPKQNHDQYVRVTEHWFLQVIDVGKPQSEHHFIVCGGQLLHEANRFLGALSAFLAAAAVDPVAVDERRGDILRARQGPDQMIFRIAFNEVWTRLGLPHSDSVRDQLLVQWQKYTWADVAAFDLPRLTERWLLTHAVTRFPLPMDDRAMLARLGVSAKYSHWVTLFALCVYRQVLMNRGEFEEQLVNRFKDYVFPQDTAEDKVSRLMEICCSHPDLASLLSEWLGAAGPVHTSA